MRALNNIYVHARELRRGDARLEAFLEYVAGFCDVLVLQIRGEHLLFDCIRQGPKRRHVHTADERLFGSPVIIDVALEKLLHEGCIQDMRKVVQGAERLKKVAQKYAKVGPAYTASFSLGFFYIEAAADAQQLPEDYDGRNIIAHLSFSEEFSARSWAQVSGSHVNGYTQQLMKLEQLHSLDSGRLEEVCSEVEMRRGLRGEASLFHTMLSWLTASRYNRFVCAPVRRCLPRPVSTLDITSDIQTERALQVHPLAP